MSVSLRMTSGVITNTFLASTPAGARASSVTKARSTTDGLQESAISLHTVEPHTNTDLVAVRVARFSRTLIMSLMMGFAKLTMLRNLLVSMLILEDQNVGYLWRETHRGACLLCTGTP